MPSLSNVPGCHCGWLVAPCCGVSVCCGFALFCHAVAVVFFSLLAAAPLLSLCVLWSLLYTSVCVDCWYTYIYKYTHTYIHAYAERNTTPTIYYDALLRVLFKRCDIHSICCCVLWAFYNNTLLRSVLAKRTMMMMKWWWCDAMPCIYIYMYTWRSRRGQKQKEAARRIIWSEPYYRHTPIVRNSCRRWLCGEGQWT